MIRSHVWVKLHCICVSLTGLCHLAWCSPSPSMLSQRVNFSSFVKLNSISLCECIIVVLSTYLVIDTWVVPDFGDVNNAEMNVGVLIFFWISVSVSSDKFWEGESLGPKAVPFLLFFGGRYLHSSFHSSCPNLDSHQQRKRVLHSPHTHHHLFIDLFTDDSNSYKCKIQSDCGLNLHFSDD